jgi:polar amino acid transport system substrate-binding protein
MHSEYSFHHRLSLAALTVGSLVLGACASVSSVAPVTPNLMREFAPTGTLRAAINFGNPILANKNSAGQPVGVSVDLAHELGKRLGVPVELVTFNAAGKVVEAVIAGQVDVAFVAIDPARGAEMGQTSPYVQIEGAYVVRKDSALTSNEQVDALGNRIMVARGSAYDLYLSRTIKAATLQYVSTSPAVVDGMVAQKLEVAAGVKQQLEADVQRVPGLRLLPGRFMVINQAMGLPKGRDAAHRYLSTFVTEMKTSGFVAQALARHAIQGAVVAP